MDNPVMFMSPYFSHTIWGGTRLREQFGYDEKGDDIGECWGISAHKSGESVILNGEYKGMKLSDVYREHPELFGNIASDVFPLLIKIIDAESDLSIQVHPDDEYARVHENGSLGKTECWYILDCTGDAKLVLGHNARTRDELKDMIHGGRWDEFIRTVPVKKGDFIQIEPGTVHAITAGCLILETQQSSDITYRVYDYDRLQNGKPRDLHIEQSVDVITVPAHDTEDMIKAASDIKSGRLIECDFYEVCKYTVDKELELGNDKHFLCVTVIEGEGFVCGEKIHKGSFFIIPCVSGQVKLEGEMTIITSTVKNNGAII